MTLAQWSDRHNEVMYSVDALRLDNKTDHAIVHCLLLLRQLGFVAMMVVHDGTDKHLWIRLLVDENPSDAPADKLARSLSPHTTLQ